MKNFKSTTQRQMDSAAAALVAQAPAGWLVTFGDGYRYDDEVADATDRNGRWVRYSRAMATEAERHGAELVLADAAAPADWKAAATALLARPRGVVVVVLNIGKVTSSYDADRAWLGCMVEGDTLLDGSSFIRRGIDCSCCALVGAASEVHTASHQYGGLFALLDGQLARCAALQARRATAVALPGLPFTVQPEWFATTAAALKAGRSVQLLPHGFGTGYSLRRGIGGRSADCRRASSELERLVGVTPITVSTFDHD